MQAVAAVATAANKTKAAANKTRGEAAAANKTKRETALGLREKFAENVMNMTSTELDKLFRAVGFGCLARGKMDGREFSLCKNAKDIKDKFPALKPSQAQLLLHHVQQYVAGVRKKFPTISLAVVATKQSEWKCAACLSLNEATTITCPTCHACRLSVVDDPPQPIPGAVLAARKPRDQIGTKAKVNMAFAVANRRKQNWLDLLLQHAVPEAVARSCIRDVADDVQLIRKIKQLLPPSAATERLMQILSFPEEYKRPWLNVFLRHGSSNAKAFVSGIKGGIPELEDKLRHLPIPRDRVEALLAEVRAHVSFMLLRVLVSALCSVA